MLVPWTLLAVALYFLPVGLYVTVAGRLAPTAPVARVLDVGIALAADTLLVLTLAKFVRLEVAVWITRGLYLAAIPALAMHRRRPKVSPGTVLVLAGVAAVVMLSVWRCSYLLIIWDRDWHVPLVSALRAQRLPFENVYLPPATLRYHYLGDVVAAAIQTLSFNTINSALALTVAHDAFLVLTAGVVALLLRETGLRRFWLAPLLVLPVVFAGPLVLGKPSPAETLTTLNSAALCGFTYLNYTTLAYRPHVVIAGLFVVLVFAVVVVRTHANTHARATTRTTASLLTSAACLALLDEASLLMLTLGLGLAYQFVPRAVHPVRGRGIFVLGGMLATLAVVNRAYDGALSPGGPAQAIEIVQARHLSLFSPAVPFAVGREALGIFLMDYFPYYAVILLLGVIALRTRRRDLVAAWVFFTALVAVSCFFAFKVEVNHAATEGHRFITAIMVLAPVVGAYGVCAAPGCVVERVLLVGVLAAVAASGMVWERSFLRERFAHPPPRERAWAGPTNPIGVNCREWVGAPRDEAPLEYAERAVLYPYAGCQPGRFAAQRSQWSITTLGAVFGPDAAAAYASAGVSDRLAAVVCAASPGTSDPACQWARQHLRCAPLPGDRLVRCPLDATTRGPLLDALSR
jgi:hypothetical protein